MHSAADRFVRLLRYTCTECWKWNAGGVLRDNTYRINGRIIWRKIYIEMSSICFKTFYWKNFWEVFIGVHLLFSQSSNDDYMLVLFRVALLHRSMKRYYTVRFWYQFFCYEIPTQLCHRFYLLNCFTTNYIASTVHLSPLHCKRFHIHHLKMTSIESLSSFALTHAEVFNKFVWLSLPYMFDAARSAQTLGRFIISRVNVPRRAAVGLLYSAVAFLNVFHEEFERLRGKIGFCFYLQFIWHSGSIRFGSEENDFWNMGWEFYPWLPNSE